MARRIVITSGKGGVGKTTLSYLIGKRLAKLNKRTLVIDLDLSLNNLDVVAGVEDKVNYFLEDVISGKCRAKQALVECSENLFIMQSSHSLDTLVNGHNVKLLADGLGENFDVIFFDCPAGLDSGFHRAVSCADEALVVLTLYPTSLRDADKVVNILKSYKLSALYAVANRVRRDLVSRGKCVAEEDCEEILKIPVIASVPEDDGVLLLGGGDLSRFSPARAATVKLAKKLVKEDYAFLSGEYKKQFERVKRKVVK